MRNSPGLDRLYSPQLELWLRTALEGAAIYWSVTWQTWTTRPGDDTVPFVARAGRLVPA